MTREQFHELLHAPATIRLNLIRDLEEITGQYPYFHNAHLLLAKQYKGHENIRFESYLRKASVYAPDRTVLFDIIHQEPETVIHIGEERHHTLQDAPSNSIAEAAREKAVPAGVTIPDVSDQPPPATQVEALREPESHDTVSREVPPTVEDPAERKTEKTPREILEARLREIESGKVVIPDQAAAKEQNAQSTPDSIRVPPEKTPVLPAGKQHPGRSAPKDPTPKTPGSGDAPEKTRATEPAGQPATHSFIEWLRLKQIPIEQTSEYTLTGFPAGKPEEAEPGNRDTSEDLIDRFIKSEPRIVPARSEFYSPGNMARQSAVVHEDLISETLARIYARQGNLSRAIETLEKLALKNPGKSRYFAALIEELSGNKPD